MNNILWVWLKLRERARSLVIHFQLQKMSKRKRNVITLEKKLEIIEELKKGKSQRCVSDIYNIPKSTIADIWKSKEKIEQHVSASDYAQFAKKRCIIREAHFEKLDQACYVWFLQQRSKGAAVSGPLLQEKALQLFPALYPNEDVTSYKASSGWLQKFSQRHGIRALSLQGESLSADTSAIEDFRGELLKKIEDEGITLNQIFNADETGLWWRLMPSKSLVHCGEKQAKNFKKSKDRVTLLGCANASGTCKLPLAFIHKSARPRCFKHMDMNTLPVHYFSQSKAWMTSKLFEKWFHDMFVPHVKKFCEDKSIEYKILLLVDNAPAHPSIEILQSRDGKVKTMFLPPNTTSVLQPMDQGILETLKKHYKKQLLRHLIIENDSSSLPVPEVLKKLTIKDAVYWSAHSWEEITPLTLSKAWKKLLCSDSSAEASGTKSSSTESSLQSSTAAVDTENFDDLFQELGYKEGDQDWVSPQEWLDEDAFDPGYQLMTDEEIIADTLNENIVDDSDDEAEAISSVTPAQACSAFDTVLEWLESEGGVDSSHLLLIKKWRNIAAMKHLQKLKQTKIHSFFKKP